MYERKKLCAGMASVAADCAHHYNAIETYLTLKQRDVSYVTLKFRN